jgi:hypothetical protein
VLGTLDNCSGGVTPWGTVLFCEEGAADWFGGDAAKVSQSALFERAGYSELEDANGWARFHDRFNVDKEPNEPNRFDWVVELDPYEPDSVPVKRTALGRFGHEAATSVINRDGRAVVYLGDDDYFEYVYKFVSRGTVNTADRAANKDLSTTARSMSAASTPTARLIGSDGLRPGPSTPDNGFDNQGDVVLQARKAGDLLGATPMDRPEDFEPNPVNGRVYLVLTKNAKRKPEQVNAANSRAKNTTGHILELLPPGEGKDADHAAAIQVGRLHPGRRSSAADQGARSTAARSRPTAGSPAPTTSPSIPRAACGSPPTAPRFRHRRRPLRHRDRRPRSRRAEADVRRAHERRAVRPLLHSRRADFFVSVSMPPSSPRPGEGHDALARPTTRSAAPLHRRDHPRGGGDIGT